jgi:tryptophan synthase alpha chain
VRVDAALREARAQSRPSLVPYVMVDRGRRGRLREVADGLRKAGATAVELGFPFSDPIADGPVLEAAAYRALANGTDWSELCRAVRTVAPILPTAVMTYANPVWRRGLLPALSELATSGASALIVPDLSLEESRPWSAATRSREIDLVLLAAPGGTKNRIAEIARRTRGFLYLVSRYGTTGVGAGGAADDLGPLVRAAHAAAPRLPVLIGFGIRDRASAARALRSGADGVIVGSALEERLSRGDSISSVSRWLASLLPG